MKYDTMRRVDISIELEQQMQHIIIHSLLPEVTRATVPRTQVNISETNVGVILTIEAENTSALRAALNSYLHWLNCIISTATTFNFDNVDKNMN